MSEAEFDHDEEAQLPERDAGDEPSLSDEDNVPESNEPAIEVPLPDPVEVEVMEIPTSNEESAEVLEAVDTELMTDLDQPIVEELVEQPEEDEAPLAEETSTAVASETALEVEEPVEEVLAESETESLEKEETGEAELEDEVQVSMRVMEPDDGRLWYVVHCYSGYENKVRHNLEQRIETMGMKDKIFDVVVPTEEEIEIKDGKRKTVERRVFPGYILVQMIMDEDSWYVVRNTPGVTGFVGMGNEPTPLRPEEVSQIVKRMEAEAPRIKVTYKTGQKVRIIDGPFNDFIGTVANIDMDRAKVRVMVSFFGRETPVELDFLQVEKA
jgi:transcriptional antiterminator NusG